MHASGGWGMPYSLIVLERQQVRPPWPVMMRSPIKQLMVVVLPAPLGPSKHSSWPFGTPNQLSATATYCFFSCCCCCFGCERRQNCHHLRPPGRLYTFRKPNTWIKSCLVVQAPEASAYAR